MVELNFFDSLDNLEPKCPKCGTIIEWGTTTEYSEENEAQVCKCGFVFKEK